MRVRRLGQVMVLACVTMLVLVLMLMLSFNLTNAIHEKIRLQQHSDAMAYSMATVEARAMNYFAYSNRAIAAAAVSEMSIHAYMSEIGYTVNAFDGATGSFTVISVLECLAALGCGPWCGSCCEHIPHCPQAISVRSKFAQATTKYRNRARGMENSFNDAVEGYSRFIDMINLGQQGVGLYTLNVLRGQDLDVLHDTNAPCASQLPVGVGALNMRNFVCALEGTILAQGCIGGSAESNDNARGRVIANVANAARGEFPKSRIPGVPAEMFPSTLADLMTQIQGQGITGAIPTGGSARAMEGTDNDDCTGDANNKRGQTICSVEKTGGIGTFFIDIPGGWYTERSEIYSNRNGGAHRPSGLHSGRHDKWRGFVESTDVSCFTDGECFTNFRSNSSADDDYGQPSVYGYFSQDLRLNTKCNKGPWELGTDGKLTMGDGAHDNQVNDPGVLDFVPREGGTAVSRALVYFHRPDDWRMPPNLFDPYWKAKLHPFDRTKMGMVLTAGGSGSALPMLLGPIEGVQ
ncbi:MAG: hypothetical protein IPJ65_24010 [Archangiaceae bacterium]|nr:hypothetical protein [Archangiaceae bacterium]